MSLLLGINDEPEREPTPAEQREMQRGMMIVSGIVALILLAFTLGVIIGGCHATP